MSSKAEAVAVPHSSGLVCVALAVCAYPTQYVVPHRMYHSNAFSNVGYLPVLAFGQACMLAHQTAIYPEMLWLQEKEPRLPMLLKLLVWAQNQLDTRCTYPRINDLAAPSLTSPMQT